MGRLTEKTSPLLICGTGLFVSLLFCFIVFPKIEGSYHLKLDPEGYALLGENIRQGEGLTFDREAGPTVYRGPVYPAFISLALFLTSGWYPGGIWIAQSLLHGLTCLFIYRIARKWLSPSLARWSGFACAVYPALFWYAPRMYTETLLSFLLAGLLFLGMQFIIHPTFGKAAGIGGLLGLLCLTKATFLILIPIFPLALGVIARRDRRLLLLATALISLLVIAPWTIRNYALTGKIVLVHTGLGGVRRANSIARDFFKNPLSYSRLWEESQNKLVEETGGPINLKSLKKNPLEKSDFSIALDEIRQDPALILEKTVSGTFMFWIIGETPLKTLVLMMLKIPVLILAAAGIGMSLRRKQTLLYPAIIVILAFWLGHIPFAVPGRLSTPLMSPLVLFAVSAFFRKKQNPAPQDP